MLKIKEIKAKSIIVKTKLPEGDFVINPYVGCTHGCKYCYARFMKKFTGHTESWGSFVDVKINAPDLIPTDKSDKYKNKYITIGSVTDVYQPLEKRYKLTRKILEKLIFLQPRLDIITKSDLVARDIDLFKKFKDCIVAISLAFLNEDFRRELEPSTHSIEKRINVLKELHETGISTALFISPIFPEITDWRELINKTIDFVDEYWFENLNLYPFIKNEIYAFLRKNRPELVEKYKKIYDSGDNNYNDYWNNEEKQIKEFFLVTQNPAKRDRRQKVNYRIYFHHKIKGASSL